MEDITHRPDVADLPQLDLFGVAVHERYRIETGPELDVALAGGAPCFLGVSGGKDSQALAYRAVEHLDTIGHAGPRYLIHSDLGRVEWRSSLSVCERLAERTGLELVVVRRQAGDLMDRWLGRWAANVSRYAQLECVKLILPWSTPKQRFCQSELKGAVLSSAVRKRFPKGDVISATGIRREESASRAKMAVWKPDERTMRKSGFGHVWNPLMGWTRSDVLDYIRKRGDVLHVAYTIFQASRVSCAFCIMSTERDLAAAARCADNQDIYREMVDLEICSTFSFQGTRWLGDVAPHLLDANRREGLVQAKERAAAREAAECVLPPHLLFKKGWPTVMPSPSEADLIAKVRRDVASAVGLEVFHTPGEEVLKRYSQLMAIATAKAAVGGLRLAKHE